MADLGGLSELALGRTARQVSVDTGGPFTIRELTGQMREVTLTDRALPYRPFTLTTTQRAEIGWLPGYAVATATILGAAEEPTTINGYWKDRFIGAIPGSTGPQSPFSAARGALVSVSASLTGGFGGQGGSTAAPFSVDGKPVLTVQEAVDLFDDICRQGQLLAVVWETQARHGHLTKFEKRWHNTHDVEWDMTFEWTGRGDPVAAAVHATDVTAQDTRALLEATLDDAIAVLGEAQAIARELTDLLDSQLQKIADLVQQVGDAVDSTGDAATAPLDTTRRMLGLLESIEGECVTAAEELESKPAIAWHRLAQSATRVGGTATYATARALGLETGSGGPARLTVAQRVDAYAFVGSMKSALRAVKYQALERRAAMARQVRSEIAGTFTARQGDDLRDAAFQFYGAVDEWRRIMLFNGLLSSALTPGQAVRVPRIAPDGSAGDV